MIMWRELSLDSLRDLTHLSLLQYKSHFMDSLFLISLTWILVVLCSWNQRGRNFFTIHYQVCSNLSLERFVTVSVVAFFNFFSVRNESQRLGLRQSNVHATKFDAYSLKDGLNFQFD